MTNTRDGAASAEDLVAMLAATWTSLDGVLAGLNERQWKSPTQCPGSRRRVHRRIEIGGLHRTQRVEASSGDITPLGKYLGSGKTAPRIDFVFVPLADRVAGVGEVGGAVSR